MDFNLSLFIIFLFGLIVGSFLNSIIYRLNNNQSFLRGRSSCPECRHQLNWSDLIPIFSFFILKGRCRYCKKPISLHYPLVEFITGVLFIFGIWNLGFDWELGIGNWEFLKLFYYLVITCFLIVIFITDFKHYIISDKIIYPAIVISFIYNLISDLYFNHLTIKPFSHSLFFSGIFAAFFIFIFFLLIYLVSRGKWIGFGDVKLAVFMGLLLGWPNILIALFLAVMTGAIIGLGLIILKKKNLKSEIPFGPFLVIGTFIALFWGDKIIQWYVNILI